MRLRKYKVQHDRKARMAYLWCRLDRKEFATRVTTRRVHPQVSLDLDEYGDLVGIEVFDLDDDMTRREFKVAMANGEPVEIAPGVRPVAITDGPPYITFLPELGITIASSHRAKFTWAGGEPA